MPNFLEIHPLFVFLVIIKKILYLFSMHQIHGANFLKNKRWKCWKIQMLEEFFSLKENQHIMCKLSVINIYSKRCVIGILPVKFPYLILIQCLRNRKGLQNAQKQQNVPGHHAASEFLL